MAIWNKKDVSREVVKELHDRYSCDALTSSILARRGITDGNDILYFLEEDARYLHNPFLFSEMEDAVDRIYDAAEEGEKVLIFGDRDADGITSTTILYYALKEMKIDVQYRIPTGDEPYGLTIEAVETFAKDYGSLIITVDCGIANIAEIKRANELGIDVIVVDHHNPQEFLPEEAIIINPKVPECGYPFADLAGCCVTYKLVSALRFAKNELYKQQICLLNVRPINDAYVIEALRIVNCKEIDRITETIVPGLVSITQTRLLPFLQGQQILVWNEPLQKKLLAKIFGNNIDFNMLDIQPEIAKTLSGVGNMSLLRLAPLSKIARYQDKAPTELDGFFNIFVTFVLKKISLYSPRDEQDLQLVMLGTLADLMPLKNENRILIKQGLNSVNNGNPRPGLQELLVRQNLILKKLSTTDISWNITPVLNAAGRLGKPEIALELFLEQDAEKRAALADQIIQMNKDRRQLGNDVWPIVENQAFKNKERFNGKITFAYDEKIHRGVTGILATKLVQFLKIPAIVIAPLDENTAVASVRSTRGYAVTNLLEQCSDLFITHGGHDFAAGFSFKRKNFEALLKKIEENVPYIEFSKNEDEEELIIDAELPHSFITPDLLKLSDKFEPYGENNPPLLFMAKNLKITNLDLMGKLKEHVKITFAIGSHKWTALYWNASEKVNLDFSKNDSVDIVFQISRNTFNGIETAQMVISDLKRC